MNTPGWYAVHTKHDQGEITIFCHSADEASARRRVMAAERCPERSILSVERRPPAHSLQPEIWAQVHDLGYEVIRSDESDDCFIFSARNWEEDSADFDTATEAAMALIEAKA